MTKMQKNALENALIEDFNRLSMEEIKKEKFTHILSIHDQEGELFKEVMCLSKFEAERFKSILYRLLHYKLSMKGYSYSVIDLADKSIKEEKERLKKAAEIESKRNALLKKLKELDDEIIRSKAIDEMKEAKPILASIKRDINEVKPKKRGVPWERV